MVRGVVLLYKILVVEHPVRPVVDDKGDIFPPQPQQIAGAQIGGLLVVQVHMDQPVANMPGAGDDNGQTGQLRRQLPGVPGADRRQDDAGGVGSPGVPQALQLPLRVGVGEHQVHMVARLPGDLNHSGGRV